MLNRFLTTLFLLFISQTLYASDGKTMFETHCMSCHVVTGPPSVAPPVFAIKNHVKRAYPQRQDFIRYVVAWVNKPDASRSLMPGAVKRFGLMPAQPVAPEQTARIAAFLYDSRLRIPNWYQDHFKAQHGEDFRQQ